MIIVARVVTRAQSHTTLAALDCGPDGPGAVLSGAPATPLDAARAGAAIATTSAFAVEAAATADGAETIWFSILAYGEGAPDGTAVTVTQAGATVQVRNGDRQAVQTPAVLVVAPGVTDVQLRTERGRWVAVRSLGSAAFGGRPRWSGAITGRKLSLRCARDER